MQKERRWMSTLTIITAAIAWLLANGLDVVSMFIFVQLGGRLTLASGTMLRHPVEFVLLYAGIRLLGTLAGCLGAAFAGKHWPAAAQVFWNALTVCAMITAVIAWLRLY